MLHGVYVMSSTRSLRFQRDREIGKRRVIERGRTRCGICGAELDMAKLQSLCVWGYVGSKRDRVVNVCRTCFWDMATRRHYHWSVDWSDVDRWGVFESVSHSEEEP